MRHRVHPQLPPLPQPPHQILLVFLKVQHRASCLFPPWSSGRQVGARASFFMPLALLITETTLLTDCWASGFNCIILNLNCFLCDQWLLVGPERFLFAGISIEIACAPGKGSSRLLRDQLECSQFHSSPWAAVLESHSASRPPAATGACLYSRMTVGVPCRGHLITLHH